MGQTGTEAELREQIADLQRRLSKMEAESAELERARRLLSEEASFRESVIERAAEGICVCHAISDHPYVEFTLWNPRMEEITGYSIEEINRLGWYQSMYPDPEMQEKARDRMTMMRVGDDLRYERWEVTRADGGKRTLGISTSVLVTHDEQIHVLALMHDVTEEADQRRRLEGHIQSLEGLLPICTSCKSIRDPQVSGSHSSPTSATTRMRSSRTATVPGA
jgi:PAS domain S-box-containing protein